MKLFNKLNIPFDNSYLTPFWLKKNNQLNDAINILHQTIVIGDMFNLISNKKKYLNHIKAYNKIYNGLSKSKSIIEWGGGFGIMADIIIRKYKNIKKYVLVDTPFMTYIQVLYFKLNKIPVNIITNDFLALKPGINLVALPFIGYIELYPDMFISTWGISESGQKSLEYCSEHRFFDCKHLLIAHNLHEGEDFPDSPLYGIINCFRQKIDDNNGYIFR